MTTTPAAADGRVLRVNVSAGGVPKQPVSHARVGPLGLEGDGHAAYWSHGGPLRAVSLLAIEAIERVQADGHPIEPGSVGENLTTTGIELARLPVATRLEIGDELLLEITSAAMPCDTIRGSFRDGQSGRISILLHPDDSRMYARVLREGTVRAGDPIRVLAPDPGSDAEIHVLLSRLESLDRHAAVARWSAAERAGYEIEWSDQGDLAYAAAPSLPGPTFNWVHGLRVVPNLLPGVLERYDRTGASGWLAMQTPPWPGAQPLLRLDVLTARPADVLAATEARASASATDPTVVVREIGPDEVEAWTAVHLAAAPLEPASTAEAWARTNARVAETAGHHLLLAELGGRPVGAAMLVTRRHAGLVRAEAIVGGGPRKAIQRALIRARVEAALGVACDLITAHAAHGSPAVRDLAALGFEPIFTRDVYRYDPPTLIEGADPG